MSRLKIEGRVQLQGEVAVRGAKNATLPVLVAAAAGSKTVTLDNAPTQMKDVVAEIEALQHIGCRIEVSDGKVEVDASGISTTALSAELSGRFRTSLLFLGLLVGKFGHAKVTMPGGCDLGDRKFDLHLEGLRRLGAQVHLAGTTIEVSAEGLVGTDIDFHLPTTTGTENIMLAACFAEGHTRIFNANTRPEIADMAACLNAMGADISVRNRIVEVDGGRELGGCRHTICKGWDEALTYMIAAAITRGEVCVTDFTTEHIRSDVAYLREAGVDVSERGGNVHVSAGDRQLRAFDLFTAPYPGVNSDMQPLFAAFASQCHGESSITDQRFTERFQYITELQKLGIPIQAYGNCALIQGPARLRGAPVRALDLRCGAALILGGLAAEGTTMIENCYQIDRGYEDIVSRFNRLGAQVVRLED
jgi:UDP-N-acetylglucosamine 1-carboxyvinyltransferase